MAWTILRPSVYAELNVDDARRAVQEGTWAAATGEATVSHIAKADITRAAAAVLTGSGHEGQTYELTGPSAVSATELAAIVSTISGPSVAVASITFEQFGEALTSTGLPPFMVVDPRRSAASHR